MTAISHFRSPDAENPLAKHLREVADRARDFGAVFGAGDWAECAGLLHDIGKFGEPFQKYIRESVQKEKENAHIESEASRAKSGRGRVNHSSAGALFAVDAFGSSAADSARALEFVVAGHHAGLPDEAGSASSLERRLEQKHLLKEIADRLPSEIEASIRAFRFPSSPSSDDSKFLSPPSDDSIALWIRMLFSCLVDADFLATESFMDSAKSESRGGYDSIRDLRERLGAHLQKKKEAAPSSPMNSLRTQICERCEKRAIEQPGLFRLTAPTGAGKTLASMTFALRHAIEHNKRRVIYAIPYTSIIEQTAKEFRDIFGAENVLEHHSAIDPADEKDENRKSRLAAENWDAPIVVTTNVQFFESLFAARTSRCRKLHNIAQSVVVLDEAQMLPPDFLAPILRAIRNLSAPPFGVSFVFCTATQPAFDGLFSASAYQQAAAGFSKFPKMTEILDDDFAPKKLFSRPEFDRVRYDLPSDWSARADWDSLAVEIAARERILCVVNRRADCVELYRRALAKTGDDEAVFCLSALQCADHRKRKIAAIKERLEAKKPTRVIATQLIEAGVDISFPSVFRALAGLDSIAQAAGRCNRGGELGAGEKGEMRIFVPPGDPRSGAESVAALFAEALLKRGRDLRLPSVFGDYFRPYYGFLDSLDKKQIDEMLRPDCLQFREAAKAFRLIDDDWQQAVVVRYPSNMAGAESNAAALAKLENGGVSRFVARELQRFVVNINISISKLDFAKMKKKFDEIDGVWVLTDAADYSEQTGLKTPADSASSKSENRGERLV